MNRGSGVPLARRKARLAGVTGPALLTGFRDRFDTK